MLNQWQKCCDNWSWVCVLFIVWCTELDDEGGAIAEPDQECIICVLNLIGGRRWWGWDICWSWWSMPHVLFIVFVHRLSWMTKVGRLLILANILRSPPQAASFFTLTMGENSSKTTMPTKEQALPGNVSIVLLHSKPLSSKLLCVPSVAIFQMLC